MPSRSPKGSAATNAMSKLSPPDRVQANGLKSSWQIFTKLAVSIMQSAKMTCSLKSLCGAWANISKFTYEYSDIEKKEDDKCVYDTGTIRSALEKKIIGNDREIIILSRMTIAITRL